MSWAKFKEVIPIIIPEPLKALWKSVKEAFLAVIPEPVQKLWIAVWWLRGDILVLTVSSIGPTITVIERMEFLYGFTLILRLWKCLMETLTRWIGEVLFLPDFPQDFIEGILFGIGVSGVAFIRLSSKMNKRNVEERNSARSWVRGAFADFSIGATVGASAYLTLVPAVVFYMVAASVLDQIVDHGELSITGFRQYFGAVMFLVCGSCSPDRDRTVELIQRSRSD